MVLTGSVYSRHPYESWPFNAMPAATHPGTMKPDAGGWWDVHSATAGGWLDMSGGVHAQMAANYAASSADYVSHSLASNTAHLLSSGHTGLLQDTYKSMLPGQGSFGLSHHGSPTTPTTVSPSNTQVVHELITCILVKFQPDAEAVLGKTSTQFWAYESSEILVKLEVLKVFVKVQIVRSASDCHPDSMVLVTVTRFCEV